VIRGQSVVLSNAAVLITQLNISVRMLRSISRISGGSINNHHGALCWQSA